jgi:hypothetical protein
MEEAADEIELLRQQRNHWMSAAMHFDEHLATFRVMLMEQPGVRFGGCTPQSDCGADRKSVASQRCRDTGGQPFDSAPITLTDAEREAVAALVYQCESLNTPMGKEMSLALRSLLARLA